jgi:uncharacterized protein YbjT (DUF2867 family)
MRIAVVGGTGRIGARVVQDLAAAGHEAVALARSTGVDVLTGEGLDDAFAGAEAVVNLTNSPTFDAAAADFLRTSTENLLAAADRAGVRHVVILSIVGADRVPDVDYYRAKVLQEDVLRAGPVPYSIVRATQFMEFVDDIMSWTSDGSEVRLPATPLQPIAADDVAAAVAEVAAGRPLNGVREIAGPEVFPLDELGRLTLAHRGDPRTVVTDPGAGLFAAVPGPALTSPDAHLGATRYGEWLER